MHRTIFEFRNLLSFMNIRIIIVGSGDTYLYTADEIRLIHKRHYSFYNVLQVQKI